MSKFLREAQDELREQLLAGEAVRCPCCTQLAKVYKRQIHAKMAYTLIRAYRVGGLEWVHLPSQVPDRARDDGMLAYWGLLEESTEPREDGGRAGWWRITAAGYDFLRGRFPVRKYAHVYDGRVLQLSGDLRYIRDCLGDKFDYDELMNR
jgi:hypothetical protein